MRPTSGREGGQSPPAPELVELADGTPLTIRAIRPDDSPRLQALFRRLSPETIYLRFLGRPKALSDQEAARLANVDYALQMAFVAVCEQEGAERIIAVARYAVLPATPTIAEAAIVVEDAYQGHGLGTILSRRLVAHARAKGVQSFQATVHPTNVRIMRFIARSGLPAKKTSTYGAWEVRVDLDPDPAAAGASDRPES